MAITVGTDTNQTVAEADTYWTNRGNTDWTSDTEANKEINLRKAADWLERNFRWRGTKQASTQRLGWPRDQAYDDDGYQIGTAAAPDIVKEAEAIVADLYRAGTNDLEGIVTDSDAAIIKEKVDVIEVMYDSRARLKGADVITHVHLMLKGVTLGDVLLRA